MRTRKHLPLVTAAAAAALTLAACDVVDDLLSEATETTEATGDEEAPAEDTSPDPDDAGTSEVEAAPEQPPVEAEESEPRFAYPDVDEIELTTPGAGEGAWPELAWEPVDGAERYSVTLYAPSGEAYWRWSGETTQIRVGAFPEEPDQDSGLGPQVHGEMSWEVLARDADGSVIAQSDERQIAP